MRAYSLQQEYIGKARFADRKYNNTPEHQVGRVECKLVQLGEIHGLVCGNFGEISQPMHNLVAAMATSRVRVAGPLRGRRGILRSKEAERSVAVSSLRRRLGISGLVDGKGANLDSSGTFAVSRARQQSSSRQKRSGNSGAGCWRKDPRHWLTVEVRMFGALDLLNWTRDLESKDKTSYFINA